jgi:hypothetical protein
MDKRMSRSKIPSIISEKIYKESAVRNCGMVGAKYVPLQASGMLYVGGAF